MVDFGVVQPGDWEFTLSRKLDGGGQWYASGSMNVLPGTTIEKTIVCPPTEGADCSGFRSLRVARQLAAPGSGPCLLPSSTKDSPTSLRSTGP